MITFPLQPLAGAVFKDQRSIAAMTVYCPMAVPAFAFSGRISSIAALKVDSKILREVAGVRSL